MSLVNEIYKPVVKIVPIEGSSSGLPANCFFEVEISFKEVDGVVPYPKLVYPSKPRLIESAENNATDLMASLSDKIQKHKEYHDFLKEKQALVDAYLNQAWGE